MRHALILIAGILTAGAASAAGPDLRARTYERQMDLTPAPGPVAIARSYGPISSEWFWQKVSPARSQASPERWRRAVATVEQATASGKRVFNAGPRVQRIIGAYRPILEREAKKHKVPLPLLIAVVAVESGGNPRAISPKGAGGLMQLMPATARRFGVRNSLAPAQNVRGGATYLRWLLNRYGGDAVLALAGYNAGEGAVDRHDGVPPYRETRDYVPKVAAAYAAARRLCGNTRCGD